MVAKVSVVMSVLNGAEYLRPAIDSVLNQTLTDLELIVIDNASTDDTPVILDGYDDPRLVRVQNDSVLTLTQSLNKGLAHARGEYVARLDADDIALPERLDRQAAFLDHHPDVTLVAAAWVDFYPDGREQSCPPMPTTHEEIRDALAWRNPLPHSSLMYRREAVQAAGGYPAEYAFAQDMALYLVLLRRHRLAALPEVLVRIRQHEQQFSARPAAALLRLREMEQLFARSNGHPELSGAARRRGRRTLASIRAHLGLALWRVGNHADGLRCWLSALATAPAACVAAAAQRIADRLT